MYSAQLVQSPARTWPTPTIGAILRETLRRHWRDLLYWGGGGALMAYFVIALAPNTDFLQAYEEITQMFPGFYEAFVGEDAAFAVTAEGYVTGEFFSWIVLVYAMYGVLAGLSVTINDEESGSLDVLLSMPVARWRVVLEKALAFTLLMAGIVLVSVFGLWLGEASANVLEADNVRLLEMAFNMLPSTLVTFAFTVFIGNLVRRRTLATWIGGVFIVASFVIDFLARLAPDSPILTPLAPLSFYRYYTPAQVIQHGLNGSNVAVLMGAALMLLAAGVLLFQRRDVGV